MRTHLEPDTIDIDEVVARLEDLAMKLELINRAKMRPNKDLKLILVHLLTHLEESDS